MKVKQYGSDRNWMEIHEARQPSAMAEINSAIIFNYRTYSYDITTTPCACVSMKRYTWQAQRIYIRMRPWLSHLLIEHKCAPRETRVHSRCIIFKLQHLNLGTYIETHTHTHASHCGERWGIRQIKWALLIHISQCTGTAHMCAKRRSALLLDEYVQYSRLVSESGVWRTRQNWTLRFKRGNTMFVSVCVYVLIKLLFMNAESTSNKIA